MVKLLWPLALTSSGPYKAASGRRPASLVPQPCSQHKQPCTSRPAIPFSSSHHGCRRALQLFPVCRAVGEKTCLMSRTVLHDAPEATGRHSCRTHSPCSVHTLHLLFAQKETFLQTIYLLVRCQPSIMVMIIPSPFIFLLSGQNNHSEKYPPSTMTKKK